MNKLVTKGLGPKEFAFVTKGYGGILYKLKTWATVFRKELVGWANCIKPFVLFNKENIYRLFDISKQDTEFKAEASPNILIKEFNSIIIEKNPMDYVVIKYPEVDNIFYHAACASRGTDKEKIAYEIYHPKINVSVDHEDVIVEIKGLIKYIEIKE